MDFKYIWPVFQRHMLVFGKSWFNNLATNIFEPFVYLIGLGFGIGHFVHSIEGLPYQTFVATGLIGSTTMMSASFEATIGAYVRYKFQRIYDAMISTPVSAPDVVFAEILYAGARAAVLGLIMEVSIIAFRFVPNPAWTAVFVPLAAFLIATIFAILGLTVVTFVPSIDHFNYYLSIFITPLFVFSGVFFPIRTLPAVARLIASLTPVMHGVRLTRDLFLGHTGHLFIDTTWLIVVSLLLLPLPLLRMKKKLMQ